MRYDELKEVSSAKELNKFYEQYKNKGYAIKINNEIPGTFSGFIVDIPLFSSIHKIYYKLSASNFLKHSYISYGAGI